MTKIGDELASSVQAALREVVHAEDVLSEMVLADDTEPRIARHLYVAKTALSRLHDEIQAKRKST